VVLEKASFPERPFTRLQFLLLMVQAGSGFLVAEDGIGVLGYVTATTEGGIGLIASIAVSPQHRRNGIGDALMRSAIEHLAGCERIWLLVDHKNAAAISLYHKHSFSETGRIIKGYYPNGDDAVEMARMSTSREN
jgi:ribosomal protein S18 acetylase RimI-like enzyme